MSSTMVVSIENAIPQAGRDDSAAILALWRDIQDQLKDCPFTAQARPGAPVQEYRVSLDLAHLLAGMEQALESGGFDCQRAAHVRDPGVSLSANLNLVIHAGGKPVQGLEAWAVASVFLQQVQLAANLVLPGAFQMLGARFIGEQSHLVEAPLADSVIFSGVRRSLSEFWSLPAGPDFAAVWAWLARAELSHTHTGIKGLNKVLLTALKVAEQRQEYSARTVLLVLFQLEILLDCHTRNDPGLLRRRLNLVVGSVPESADCIRELYTVRNELFTGTQPVHRPPLLTHTEQDALEEQLGQYNMAVVHASTLVLVLLRELVAHDATGFVFRESVTTV